MRFTATGPAIPTHLLEQQAQGNVIFFCGAGLSVPAGLDTFWRLTTRIIDNLDAAKARTELADNRGIDRVFNSLVREYGRDEIDRQIYVALGTQKPKTLRHHKDILDLSRGAGGSLQIVTTNFDLLFEKARKVRAIVPPGLPDLELNQSINGVVYLHGRLAEPSGTSLPSYVISSSDFGRAYLAEGWATRFVKALREQYTLVLLGYSADDPPMRYLLEGLNSRDGHTYQSPIYAFTDQDESDAEERWTDRGVTPICYHPNKTHSELWSTIGAWAKAATSPNKWADSVIKLAQTRPTQLAAYERGKVVEFVSTRSGAKAFADAEPPISAEWLCVFDPHVRYASPRKESWEPEAKEIDPRELFGIDSDPERPPPDPRQQSLPEGAANPLAWNKGDGHQPERLTLQGWHRLWNNPLPERLHHLARWFGSRAHEPAAVWWAAGSRHLNPHLLWFISIRLRDLAGTPMPAPARQIWEYYLESAVSPSADDREYPWFEFQGVVKQAGWTSATMRFFERCVAPSVVVSRPSLGLPKPPDGDWDELRLRSVVDLKVSVLQRHGQNVVVPTESLCRFVGAVRVALVRISELLEETGDVFWHAPTLHPTGEAGETFYGEKEQFFLWFKELFQQLLAHDAVAALAELEAWPTNERRMFPKLRMWAASLPQLQKPARTVQILQSLEREVFWNSYNHRELLFLLRSSWPSLTHKQKRTVERMMTAGPPKWVGQSRLEHRRRRASHAASDLRWLQLNQCELSDIGQRALDRLKVVDLRWTDEWAKSADESYGSRGGSIHEDVEPQGLDSLPLGDIVSQAERLSEDQIRELTHYRPFKGLVADKPFTALSSLRLARRKGNFPIRFWINLISEWPDKSPHRLTLLMANTVASLSNNEALDLRYYTTAWLEKNLMHIYKCNRATAFHLFDGFLRPFITAPNEFCNSSMGETTVGGVIQDRSEVSVNKSINSPIGHMTEALWSVLPKKGKRVQRPSKAITDRFDILSRIPGHGSGHAISTLTKRASWIFYKYEEWFTTFLLPKFAISHPLSEAAWHGLAYNSGSLGPDALSTLKMPWLQILKGEAAWNLDSGERQALIQGMVWLSQPNMDFVTVFTFDEVRSFLIATDDEGRSHALWALSHSNEQADNWSGFVKPFIKNAWPKNLRYRSESTTRSFVQLAERSGVNFPDVVRTVLDFVRPVPNADLFTYRITQDREDRDNIARLHPAEALLLLNAITGDDRAQMPYELSRALQALGELQPALREAPEYRRLRGLVE